jgi:hypothetical protein
MTRVARHLAALALAGTVASVSVVAATPASAGPAGARDGFVNITRNNVVITPNVQVPIAANLCGIKVNAVLAVDKSGGKTECKAESTSKGIAWVEQN